jgi:hypothetical protein
MFRQIELPAVETANAQGGSQGTNGAGGEDEKPSKNFLFRLSLSEWLTFLVGAGTLAVAVLGYINALDTTDIKHAVSDISALATQTKREADQLHDQFGQIKRQADDADTEVKTLGQQFGQMQQQTVALQGTATAAQGQLTETRIEQQPVISVIDPTMVRNGGPSPFWDITVDAQNSGNIPPKWAETVSKYDPVESDSGGMGVNYAQSPDDPEKLFSSQFAKDFAISSTKVFGSRIPIQVAQANIPEWALLGETKSADGISFFPHGYFLYGAIRYMDWLRPKPHLVKFCFVIQAEGMIVGAATETRATGRSTECHHWNCADEECKADKRSYDREMVAVNKANALCPINSYPAWVTNNQTLAQYEKQACPTGRPYLKAIPQFQQQMMQQMQHPQLPPGNATPH